MNIFELKFGDVYEDKISGFKGFAIAFGDSITLTKRVCLMGKGNSYERITGTFFDWCRLDKLDSKNDLSLLESSIGLSINLFDIVNYKLNDFKGVVVARTRRVDGFHHVLVQPQCHDIGEYKQPEWIEASLCQVTGSL